jgi:hypothetical protein
VKQIQFNEQLQYSNSINYQQAYRVKLYVLEELWGNESECFAQFPNYIDRFKAIDSENKAWLDIAIDGAFQATFFAPAGVRHAGRHLRSFTAIDGTHTKSQYRMILLVACGIDANDHVVPLAWALVPIEDEFWWKWFLGYLKLVYPHMELENYAFISDREKGIINAVEVLPSSYSSTLLPAYCRQRTTTIWLQDSATFLGCCLCKNKHIIQRKDAAYPSSKASSVRLFDCN